MDHMEPLDPKSYETTGFGDTAGSNGTIRSDEPNRSGGITELSPMEQLYLLDPLGPMKRLGLMGKLGLIVHWVQ